MCKGTQWCERYIKYLIESFWGNKHAFQWNVDIQINYYGKGDFHAVLKQDIDKALTDNKLEGLTLLKIFSYFTCISFDVSEVDIAREYLKSIEKLCKDKGYKNIVRIINEIRSIIKKANKSEPD